jgi:hypothetical protein
MNKTQKFALWGIINLLLAIAFLALFLVSIFFFKWWMPLPARIACLAILVVVFFLGVLFLAARKQSKKEVETDEMDISLQKVAAIISFSSVLVLEGVLLNIANLVWGLNAAVPLWVLMLLFVALVIVGVIVFAVAILIQYGRGGKGGNYE